MLQPVIICGGEGKRLWPISRKKMPKQFLNFFSGKSLFELTLQRIKKIKNARNPIIVLSKNNENLVNNILKNANITCQMLLEPEGKGTAAAIYLAAKESCDNDTLFVLPSDHFIEDDDLFLKTINHIKENILQDYWYTFGIQPSYPSTAYGYIKTASDDESDDNLIKDVINFTEKPSLKIANSMFVSEGYLWNSGMFLGNVNMIKKTIKYHASNIAFECDKVFKKRKVDLINKTINFDTDLFSNIFSDSIDYAILENESKIKCIKLNIKWSDLGSWDKFLDYIDNDLFKDKIIEINGQNNVINLDNRMIGTVGVENLIIIDTKEATLITKRGFSEYLPQLISAFKEKNINLPEDLSFDERPWGRYDILFQNNFLKVKKLIILPNQSISLQYHNQRSEHWIVVSGLADVYIDGKNSSLKAGQSIDISKKSHHSVSNKTNEKLIIIEVQMGDYFGEDDIIRLNDPYNRV
tara:strand:- start:262 stop:1662 length:1401 start_codon:yes stop_codon:yes gene_type:complete